MLRRRLMVGTADDYSNRWVDLGLPSGMLWATGSLVKKPNGKYTIGEEAVRGTFVSWGNIVGHNENEGYDFSSANYQTTPGYSLSASIPSNDAQHDICLAQLGYPWRLPERADFRELKNNTDNEWVADFFGDGSNISGCKFMNKKDHSKYVFFVSNVSNYANSIYWSSTKGSGTYAYNLNGDLASINAENSYYRYKGYGVQPVYDPLYIDLGLPSGRLWAKGNIKSDGNGGYKIAGMSDFGLYFSWGNTTGYAMTENHNFSKSNYASSPGASVSTDISSSDTTHDAARALLGGLWHLPTKEDFQELINYTDSEWVYYNSTNYGQKFMKKTDHTVYIYLPACGYRKDVNSYSYGDYGYYWSSKAESNNVAYTLRISTNFSPQVTIQSRYYGCSIRPVI